MNANAPKTSQTKRHLFGQLSMLATLLLLVNFPESVASFQSHHSFRTRLPRVTKVPTFGRSFLKLSASLINQDVNLADTSNTVDSSDVNPCLDQWVTLPTGEIMGIIYHSNAPHTNEDEEFSMNDGDIIATSPVLPDDLPLLQEGINVATIAGTQYTLLNRATVEMTQHYNKLLETNDPTVEDMPPIPTAASAVSSTMTPPATAAGSDPLSTSDTPEIQANDDGENKVKALLQKVKDAGVSGAISYALWELAFWTLSIPVCVVAYRSLTGHWPDLQSGEDLKQLGGEAFVFVNLARFAVPIRIGLALSTVPWVQTNLVDRFLSPNDGNGATSVSMPQGEEQQSNADQMRAMEEYQQYLHMRSPELHRKLQYGEEESSGMSAIEEYQQYRSNRSPELQQQYQQYQQPNGKEPSADPSAAMEEYQQYQQQRSPELQQQYQQYQGEESSADPSAAMEEYLQYQQQRSPELQQQYQQYQQANVGSPSPAGGMGATKEYQQ